MLATKAARNASVGPTLENPSDSLSANAQIVSNSPATNSIAQVTPHLRMRVKSTGARRLGFPGTARVSSGAAPLGYRDRSRLLGTGRALGMERGDQVRDLLRVGGEREVAGVEEMELCVREVGEVGAGAVGDEVPVVG